VSTAEVITVFGTGKPEAGSAARLAHDFGVTGVAIEVVLVSKPAHWPCERPSTQLGPRRRVGCGVLPVHSRLPPTLTRLMSEVPCVRFDVTWTLPRTLPSQARQGPILARHSKLPLMTMSGPWKPFGDVPLHELMRTLPPTV